MKTILHYVTKILPLVLILLPLVTFAATDGFGKLDEAFSGTVDAGTELVDAIRNIVNVFLILASIGAAIMIVYGGVKYITSAGNENQAEEGKKTVVFALIGLLVIGLSAVLVNFVIGAINRS